MNQTRMASITTAMEEHSNDWDAAPLSWHGSALGTEASVTISAPKLVAEAALNHVVTLLDRVEGLFNLYDPDSILRRLNRESHLNMPAPEFLDLCQIATRVHVATHGTFDPTIQPLWLSLATGTDPQLAREKIGWRDVNIRENRIEINAGQQLSFNGVAQGFATDLVVQALRQLGVKKALVNIGEYRAIGGPFRLGLTTPGAGLLNTIALKDEAISLSHARAQQVGGGSHILDPKMNASPNWETVAVRAKSAALADACSTAFALMSQADITACLPKLSEITHVTLVGLAGEIIELPAE